MRQYAFRILPSWPWSLGNPGAVVGAGGLPDDADECELIRRSMPNAEHYELIRVGDDA